MPDFGEHDAQGLPDLLREHTAIVAGGTLALFQRRDT
jgi:hypothetical protein